MASNAFDPLYAARSPRRAAIEVIPTRWPEPRSKKYSIARLATAAKPITLTWMISRSSSQSGSWWPTPEFTTTSSTPSISSISSARRTRDSSASIRFMALTRASFGSSVPSSSIDSTLRPASPTS